jgi:hypothetical protein
VSDRADEVLFDATIRGILPYLVGILAVDLICDGLGLLLPESCRLNLNGIFDLSEVEHL